jgi:hypothetical protein
MLEGLIEKLVAAGARFLTMEDAVAEYRAKFPNGLPAPGG